MTRFIRQKVLSAVLALCLLLPGLSMSVSAGGTLRLTDESDLKTLLCNPDNWGAGTTFLLMKDIAVSDAAYETGGIFEGGFVPVGTPETPFSATLIGNDRAITNLKFALGGALAAGQTYIGLFGCMKNATVRNLTLNASAALSSTFTACELFAGGLAGSCTDSVVQNCGVTYTLTGGFTGTAAGTFSRISAGAFFGTASGVNAFRCTAKLYFTGLSVFSGSVTADVGAFAGALLGSDLSDCTAGGSVSSAEGMPYLFETSAPLTLNAGGIAGLMTGTSLTSCKSDCAMTLTALKSASSAGTLNINGGGLAGQMVSGYVDKCAAAGDVIINGRLSGSGQRALCGGGLIGKIFPSEGASAFLVACSFAGALNIRGDSSGGAPPVGTAYSAAGGIAGFCGGAGTVTLSDCGFFGTVDTYELPPVSSLQTVYSGGLVGRAVTETAPLSITGCLSGGAQTAQNGGYIYAGGLLGYVYGNNMVLGTCLFSGSLKVKGEGQYFYGAGAVACTGAGTSNPAGSVIRGTLAAGTLSVTGDGAVLFKASFAYLLRRTNVLNCCAADSALKAIVSPSLDVSPYTYITELTAIQAADAATQDAYASLTEAGGWKWSALFERPVFAETPTGCAGALWAEPDAGNPVKFPQADGFYEKDALVGCAAFADIPSPYPLSRIAAFSSSNEAVVTVKSGAVRAAGAGRAVVTVLYRQYAADKETVVTSSRTFEIYVRCAALPSVKTVAAAQYLKSFYAGGDLYAAADACERVFGAVPSFYIYDTPIAADNLKGRPVRTGYASAVFPESAGLGTNPYYLVMAGDCTGDGLVDWFDLWFAHRAAVKQFDFGDSVVGTAQKYAADVNADGVIDALDAMCIELCASGHTALSD